MMIWRLALCAAVVAGAAMWGWAATAQAPACRYYKVQAVSANVSKDARDNAVFIDLLDKGEIVCVTRDQKVGDRDWVFVAHKVPKPGERTPVEGWTTLQQLVPLSAAEVAVITGAPQPTPPAAAAPADDILRFTQAIPFGPYPVNGSSIQHLAEAIPQFPPFDGLEESMWKKPCSTCHKWDRQALCEQGASYAKNPRNALRHPHPYGGAYKSALMQWARSGCQ